jgi:hypothetical protein
LDEELRNAVDPTGKLSAEFNPAEFNRKLKESVEASPPASYPRPPAPTAIQSPPALQDPVPEYPLGDVSPADVTGGARAPQPGGAKRGSAAGED